MRIFIVALLLFCSTAAAAVQPITEGQKGLLSDLLQDDLSIYLQGGKAQFSDDWARVATTWTTDQEIGQRYASGVIAADEFYADRVIFLRGHYLSARNWIGDTYRVQLALVVALVDKSESAFLQDARNGAIVEMACRSGGQEYQFVYVKQCMATKFAIADLVMHEQEQVLSRRSAGDLIAIKIAERADASIAADDSCRNAMGGCIEDIKALIHRLKQSKGHSAG